MSIRNHREGRAEPSNRLAIGNSHRRDSRDSDDLLDPCGSRNRPTHANS